jgi:HEAT repeat protein
LNLVCDRLEEAIAAGPPAESHDAAEALAYIGDPVAVPHIARVMAADYRAFRWMLFPALRRIGSADAVETLISFLSSPDEEVRIDAKRNLGRIMEETADQAIKSRIKAFLP